MKLACDILVEDPRWSKLLEVDAIVDRVMSAVSGHLKSADFQSAEFSILFSDNAKNHELNRLWRKIDKTTNVLAFPAVDFPDKSAPRYVGDIAIALDIVCDEAQKQEKPLEAHVSHLVLHGLLHLFGYDHESVAEAAEMESFETRILASMGIPDPYA